MPVFREFRGCCLCEGESMSPLLGLRVSRIVMGLLLVIAATVLTVAGAIHPAGASTLGGPISRSEVLSRAQDWNDQDVPYCTYDKTTCANKGTPWAWDLGDTRQYRPDCSGFVDMAWHLNAD